MELDDLVTVYSVENATTAEIIKNALQAEGIRCTIEGANQAGEAGLMAFEIRLQVRAEDADEARRFIESHENASSDEEE